MCAHCDSWIVEGRLRRREIRHSKDGPEEMPHRKKGGSKQKKERSDHKHIYVREIRETNDIRWNGTPFRWWKIVWQCAEFDCNKVKKVRYIYNESGLDGWR